MIKKICPNCKKEFIIKRQSWANRYKYCSHSCAQKARWKNNPWPIPKYIHIPGDRSGALNPMFGRIGSLNPMFGKKRPDIAERCRKLRGALHPCFGKKNPKAGFKLGNIPWNKGQIGQHLSIEHRKNLSKAAKGKNLGINNGRWKGGKTIFRNHILIKNRDHPYANSNGYVSEHRLIAEKILGRFLGPNERVHHIDFNGINNKSENLLICNSSYHQSLHEKINKLNLKNYFKSLGGNANKKEHIILNQEADRRVNQNILVLEDQNQRNLL